MMGITFDLRTAAEQRNGSAFSDEEYRLALPEAKRKLERINHLYGTHHGEPYLAILISEAVQAQRLIRYLNTANDLWKQARLEGLT
jgi:hypothetical protein